jgi:hypothetical protein
MARNDLPLSDAPGSTPNIPDWPAGAEEPSVSPSPSFTETEEATASVTSLLYLVKPRLNACPDPLLIQALRTGARRFVRDTEAWRERIELPSVAGEDRYDMLALLPYSNIYLQRLIEVKVHGLTFFAGDYWLDHGVLALRYPTPQSGQPMRIEIAVMPAAMCDTYPAAFLPEFSDGIVAAVLADLKSERGRPYSDPDNVPLWESRYQNAVGIAKRDVATEHKAAQPFRAGEFY